MKATTPMSASFHPIEASGRPQRWPSGVYGNRAASGFTLLEVLVVLAIVAAISSIVGPVGWRALNAASQRGAESELQAVLASLPLAAFAQGRPLSVDAAGLTRRLGDVPENCSVIVPSPLTYSANGMTRGGTVQLACDGSVAAFEIAPVTGDIRRADLPAR